VCVCGLIFSHCAFYTRVRRETSRRCVGLRPQAAEELESLYEKKLAKEARRYDELRKLLDDTRYEVEDRMREQAMQFEQRMQRREQEFEDKLRQERERQEVLEDRNLDIRCVLSVRVRFSIELWRSSRFYRSGSVSALNERTLALPSHCHTQRLHTSPLAPAI
jgi:hypothetical protein